MTSKTQGAAGLRLVPVDNENRAECRALSVTEEQLPLVASNAKSLREAAQDPSLVPRALMDAERVVGFAMYQRRGADSAHIWRVMVGEEFQGRGFGRRLMELLLAEVKAGGARRISISHRPQNRAAAHLFEQFGFVEQDLEPDGEVVRLLELGD